VAGTNDAGTTRRARLFWNGRSQAVRLPREFRFDGDEVGIRREGEAVVLEPIKQRWPDGYWSWVNEHQDELELGDVEPLGGALSDLAGDDDA
jgi:virulence-associated protein VagC